MFDRRISTIDAAALPLDEHLATVHALLSSLQDFAVAGRNDAALQHDNSSPTSQSIAVRYAAANSITRRRFDALLREAETVARLGFGLIAGRQGRSDPGTITAARFLGRNITTTLQRLETLLTPRTI